MIPVRILKAGCIPVSYTHLYGRDRLVAACACADQKLQYGYQALREVLEPVSYTHLTRVRPVGVTHSANMADPEDWVNPMRGYAYDSFNKDALLRLAKAE